MIDLKTSLSENFSLGELLQSTTAERQPDVLEQQLNPPDDIVANLRYVCESTLQPLREKLGFPIRITSGYRCPKLNELVGGSTSSQHRVGQAADVQLSTRFLSDPAAEAVRAEVRAGVLEHTGKKISADANPNFYLFAYVCLHLDELDIDQVIHEYGRGYGRPAWVHLSASTDKNRRQIVALGNYVPKDDRRPDLKTALSFGV